MKYIVLLLLMLSLFSCNDNDGRSGIYIDLNDYKEKIEYSSFVDSISYLTFQFGEDNLMGNVKRIYQWNDFYYIWASHRSGIFIYHKSGKLHAHINSFGEGPECFREISSFTIVSSSGDAFIHDYASQKMFQYDKDGQFIQATPCPFWCMDILKFDAEHTLFMSPMYGGDENPSGIWMTNGQNRIIKHLSNNVNSDHKFYYYPNMYNLGSHQAYHYDRNWDEFSIITQDNIQCIYRFLVKQKLPSRLTRNPGVTPVELDGYGICDNFAYSSFCLLMDFCRFAYDDNQEERSYVWAMVGSDTKQVKLAKELYNDIDATIINNRSLFYLDNHTWARICDEDSESLQLRIQVLHLKR